MNFSCKPANIPSSPPLLGKTFAKHDMLKTLSPESAEAGGSLEVDNCKISGLKLPRNKKGSSQLDTLVGATDTGYTRIDDMLMREKASNKLDTWVKLDKVSRLSRLSAFSFGYGTSQSWTLGEIDALRDFLFESLTKGRLKRASEVIYNRMSREITAIPCLEITRADILSFSLSAINPKRLTTIKSLTPKRLSVSKCATEPYDDINV